MTDRLAELRIDRDAVARTKFRPSANIWIAIAALAVALLAYRVFLTERPAVAAAESAHPAPSAASGVPARAAPGALSASGYIVAAHRVTVASRVSGTVAWIHAEEGDVVQAGQILVKINAVDYELQLQQARAQLAASRAQLLEQRNGSRVQEIGRAQADQTQVRMEFEQAKRNLDRQRSLFADGLIARQALEETETAYETGRTRLEGLSEALALVRNGTRPEQIALGEARVAEAEARVSQVEFQLEGTVLHAPITGTVLERNVQPGEVVTPGAAGASSKSYLLAIADLSDLAAEIDVTQNAFSSVRIGQAGEVTVDAFPGRTFHGQVRKVSPIANRQTATVQLAVKILDPDRNLRPDMSATVVFPPVEAVPK